MVVVQNLIITLNFVYEVLVVSYKTIVYKIDWFEIMVN